MGRLQGAVKKLNGNIREIYQPKIVFEKMELKLISRFAGTHSLSLPFFGEKWKGDS